MTGAQWHSLVTRLRATRPARLAGYAFGAAILSLLALVLAAGVPRYADVRAAGRGSESILLDRHGAILERVRLDHKQRMLEWISLDAMAPTLPIAVIAAEDRRFWYHPGVDPIGAASALVDNFKRERPRGASTITMQLASLLDSKASACKECSARTINAKLRQVRDALAIELWWSKREILEAYLNLVPFRGELVGIDAAARGLLAKGAGGLDTADVAVLAALIRAPGAARYRVGQRACAVLKTMEQGSACDRARFVASALPQVGFPIAGISDAPHLARRLLRKPDEKLRVTVDASLQHFASETLRTHLAELRQRNVEDGAVLVLDNRSGEVLSYVGSSGELSSASAVDGVAALRQPGSTLKPFLYALAIDQRWLTASSVLDDSPLALTTPSGLYIPQDYDRRFRGAVSVRAALGSSLNVPAVRALTMVGVDRFLGSLRDLGLSNLTRSADHYGFGLALGGAETSLLELTNAYRALANGGGWTPVRFTTDPARTGPGTDTADTVRIVFSPQASFIIGDMLADPVARVATFGLSSPLSTRSWAAVKTGTSKGMRDNWAIGYTERYTVGVWVGNFSGAPMWDVSGVTGAAPIWRDIVEHLHEHQGGRPPVPPPGVKQQEVVFKPAFEAPRKDWVIVDGGPSKDQAGSKAITSPMESPVTRQLLSAQAQLIAPPDTAIIAPDPDIPERRQSLLLQSSGGQTCMRLDGKAVARCGQSTALLSLPTAGKHVLVLYDPSGRELDKHVFEVRGIAAKSLH